jgi:small subunit ribosomal protein S16
MAVKIRLRRTGRKKQPSYRLVVADTATPRDGQYLDSVGTYNPLTRPADLRIDLEKVDSWLARGAGMTDTVASLIRKARSGGDRKVAVRGVGPDEKPEAPVVEAPAAAEKPKPGSRGAAKAVVADEAPTEPAATGPSGGSEAEPVAPTAEAEPVAPTAEVAAAPPASATDAAEQADAAPADDAAAAEPDETTAGA